MYSRGLVFLADLQLFSVRLASAPATSGKVRSPRVGRVWMAPGLRDAYVSQGRIYIRPAKEDVSPILPYGRYDPLGGPQVDTPMLHASRHRARPARAAAVCPLHFHVGDGGMAARGPWRARVASRVSGRRAKSDSADDDKQSKKAFVWRDLLGLHDKKPPGGTTPRCLWVLLLCERRGSSPPTQSLLHAACTGPNGPAPCDMAVSTPGAP